MEFRRSDWFLGEFSPVLTRCSFFVAASKRGKQIVLSIAGWEFVDRIKYGELTFMNETETPDRNEDDMVIENNNAFLMAMGAGSRIEIHAADRSKESWTQLEMTASAGDTTITVQEHTGWDVGDKIAIASTSNDYTQDEEFSVLAISEDGKTITLGDENGNPTALDFTHLGVTQEYDNGRAGEDHRAWDVEVRAEVALLSRNITIQGDEDSGEDGFGGHTMIMNGAEQHISGAEFYRMGQEDILGRYPIHWHMLGEGAEGQYVEGVSVHSSYQKGATIHGTSNIRYEDNVIFDHVGHGLFFEDGSENNNQIYGNLVFGTKESLTGEPIPTDAEHVSSYWIENPNNAFIGNHAAGSQSNGFWIFEGQLHGLSALTDVGDPGQLHDLVFIGNTSHTGSGAGGAGGTDKLLGIDGTIIDDLDFRQSTLVAEFGVIEGFTAYEGNVWSLTHEMVFSDSSFTDVRFFSRHENVIQDTVFDGGTLVLYRDGGNQYNDVLMTGGARIAPQSSDHVNTPQVFNNVVDGGSSLVGGTDSANQQSILDLDGTYTGVVGGFLTPGGVNSVFNANPGAVVFDGDLLSEYTVGATEVTALGINGAVRVLRAEDGESIDALSLSTDSRVRGDDNEDRSEANYEFYTTAGTPQDQIYLIDFADAPNVLTLNLANVRAGESVTYEVQNITQTGAVTGGIEVSTLNALVRSDETAYLHQGDSLYIRIVADRVEVQDERPVEDLLAQYRAFGKIEIAGLVQGGDSTAGNRAISTDLVTAVANMPVRVALPDPEPAAPAVDTNNSYIGYDLTLTEAQSVHEVTDTIATANFEVNYDVSSRTVSINGTFSDLASNITMMHLHAGAENLTGAVLGGLTIETLDSRNGTFSGDIVLSAAEAAAFIDGDTYVNLHAIDNPAGALRGQVEVYAAGDFVLDRYTSTSDTTLVTDDMARWSQAGTWGGAGIPDMNDIVVIGPGQTVILDATTSVTGIIVNGGVLIVEDMDGEIDLSTDYLLVINGGLFQAGTETDPLDTDFTLTLEGDDPEFDLHVTQILVGDVKNTVFADADDSPLAVVGQSGSAVVGQAYADQWHSVTFDQTMDDPIVAASIVTANGILPVHLRVQNVTESGFEFQLEEWQYQDGIHAQETVSWTAVERGIHTLEDGSIIQAGSTDVNHVTSRIEFSNAFDEGPVVIGQVASERGEQAVTDRILQVNQDGFNVFLQEEEASSDDGLHIAEDFHWIAFEEGAHANFAAGSLIADDSGSLVTFDAQYDGSILADMQTAYGLDTATVRFANTEDGTVEVYVQEEQSHDAEVDHLLENIAFVQTDEFLFA